MRHLNFLFVALILNAPHQIVDPVLYVMPPLSNCLLPAVDPAPRKRGNSHVTPLLPQTFFPFRAPPFSSPTASLVFPPCFISLLFRREETRI